METLPDMRSKLTQGFHRSVNALVDFGGRSPFIVLALALIALTASWTYASHLDLRSDFFELLPRNSPSFQAYERQLARVGGSASLVIVVESPDRKANEHFIDAASDGLHRMIDEQASCAAACKDDHCRKACGPQLISYVESGTKEVRSFYQSNKWLYASLSELEDADATIDRRIATKSGLVEDLDSDDAPAKPAASTKSDKSDDSASKGADDGDKGSLGLAQYQKDWDDRAKKYDDFPTGYFITPDGKMAALKIVSPGTGTGDSSGDLLFAKVKKLVTELNPSAINPDMRVGYAGDIPNAVAEKESLLSEAALATGMAFSLILAGIVIFYRSIWAPIIIGVPPLLGVGFAYAFATATYGYVNTSGAFLGAIIIGNGINYPIVLYSRYKEFRARGMTGEVARREAVWNAFRAELVGAGVASIAYGSLTVTQFRGFSQFGVIGFVGMILVWISMIPCVPALIVAVERFQSHLPHWLREREPTLDSDQSRGVISRVVGNITERIPRFFVAVALGATMVAAVKLPGYLKDPWEYNLAKLGSKGSRKNGAGEWSNKADIVFAGKANLAGPLVLADTPEQVPLVKAQILANDAKDPQGSLIKQIATVADFLPGSLEEQKAKLEVLERIRDRLKPSVLARLSDDERKRADDMRPPERLGLIHPDDLPALLKRRFQEKNGTVGSVFYVQYRPEVSPSEGRVLLRISKSTDNVVLPDGTLVRTATRSSVFAEMIRSMERDGPLATFVSFGMVILVVIAATASKRGSFAVLASLLMGVTWMLGIAAYTGEKLNFLNFITLPITFGIGAEYPFNIYDRSRLLGGDVTSAVKLHLGAVSLCSFTTIIGYGSLIFADNQALQSFGRLAAIGECCCLFAALFFLPSVLHMFKGKEVHHRAAETTAELLAKANREAAAESPVDAHST